MLNDGYGEAEIDLQDAEAVIHSYNNWILTVVSNALRSPMHPDKEDWVQEVRYAMWKAFQKHDPKAAPLDYWLKLKATSRVKELQRRDPFLGEVRSREQDSGNSKGHEARDKIRDHLRVNPNATNGEIAAATGMARSTVTFHMKRLGVDVEVQASISLDALMDGTDFDITAAGDVIDGIIKAYHRGALAEHFSRLTDNERRYVELKFWEGLSPSELKEAFGYEPHAVWRGARKKLLAVILPEALLV